MPTSMACDELACCRIRKKLLLYLDKIGVIGLELNSEGKNFSFICCAKQRTILLGVPLAWRVLHDQRLSDLEWSFFSMIKTCDRSANVYVACSTFLVTRGSCSAVSKGVVHSRGVFSSVLVFFRLFLVVQSNFDDLKGLESVLELAIYGQQVNGETVG